MITTVSLLSVPLDHDYKHTMYFADTTAQEIFMRDHVKYSFTDFTYQRKDSIIRVPLSYDESIKCNYVMYNNGGKTYYCFITNYEFKNDDQTDITIETDVLQTYMFEYSVLPSFVEREHVDDDTIGLHTIPENLEVGEYVCQYRDHVSELMACSYVFGVTESIVSYNNANDPVFDVFEGNTYNGIYSGVHYQAYPRDKVSWLNGKIKDHAKGGKNEGIKCLFMYPTALIDQAEGTFTVNGSDAPNSIIKEFVKTADNTENPFKPKNNKVLTFPYHYLLVSNNNGGSAVYQFELFDDEKIQFNIKGCLTPGGSIRMVPMFYKGQSLNHEEGINLGKYPICNWASDEYTNWLTQNSVNIGLSVLSGAGQIAGGVATAIATGGAGIAVGGGMVVSGASTIANQLAQIHQMSFTSPQSRGNVNCGDVIAASNTNTFYLQHMRIKDEYAKVIDDYFSMFGYKCNRVKIPNKNHRACWWFTKTIDVNIRSVGTIPQSDLEKIKNCYNSGITFWKNNIKNYSLDNPITT